MKDIEIGNLIQNEDHRQKSVINLIASENYVSDDVLSALGSVLTNKYAEGYPGARYYGGNSVIDDIERLCQSRALSLFGLDAQDWSVNVQALSGSPANLAVLTGLVPQGGRIMGMSLRSGGHLTHGHRVSATGMFWHQIPYEVDPQTELIDYDALQDMVIAEKPDIIIAGFTAYPRVVDWERFRAIADSVVYPELGRKGALLLADISHVSGLIAGGMYPSPFPHADVVTTTTHKVLRGPRGALIFSRNDNRGLPVKIDKAVFPGLQGGPHENAIAAIAVALYEARNPEYQQYVARVIENAQALAGHLAELGWRVVSGGTDSHMILVDTWMNGAGIPGKMASERLESAGIIVNMNSIPGDTRKPNDPSGIRIGTPAITTQGYAAQDMYALAVKIDTALRTQ